MENDLESDSTELNQTLGIEGERRVPAETVDGRRPRLVFAPHPTAISDRIEMPEEERIVDLTGAGFVAAGVVGELDMGDARQVLLQASRDVALHHLHMVDIVLHEQ